MAALTERGRRVSLRDHAERAGCTEAEVEAVVLHDLGWGYRRIAAHQGVSMTTTRDRVRRAAQRIEQAKRRDGEA